MASPELPTTIGRYEVVSRLGQGGMGSLYLAKDPKIGRLMAIKLVRQEFESPEARQRFAREALLPVARRFRLRKIGGQWKMLVPTTAMPKAGS